MPIFNEPKTAKDQSKSRLVIEEGVQTIATSIITRRSRSFASSRNGFYKIVLQRKLLLVAI